MIEWGKFSYRIGLKTVYYIYHLLIKSKDDGLECIIRTVRRALEGLACDI